MEPSSTRPPRSPMSPRNQPVPSANFAAPSHKVENAVVFHRNLGSVAAHKRAITSGDIVDARPRKAARSGPSTPPRPSHLSTSAEPLDSTPNAPEQARFASRLSAKLRPRALSPVPPPDYSSMFKPVESLRVPVGCGPGDRLGFIDMDKMLLTGVYFSVGASACEGDEMGVARPPTNLKTILLDGVGLRVGGSATQQHATRLAVHCADCTARKCFVLGCRDAHSEMFRDAINAQGVGRVRARAEKCNARRPPPA